MKLRVFLATWILWSSVTACGPLASTPREPRARAHAPTSANDVGIAVHAASIAKNTLAARLFELSQRHPEMSVRWLHNESGMLEVFSVPGLEIARALPEASVLPNVYRAHLAPPRIHQARASCTLPLDAVRILTQGQERVAERATLVVSGYREFELKIDTSHSPPNLDLASVRWEVIHSPTLRTVARLRGLNARLTLQDPGEYRVRVVALERDRKTPCSSGVQVFALRSTPALASPGSIAPLPPLERLGVYFPHLITVEAIPARAKTALGEGILVAIIDTGVHYNHPDLHPQVSTTARGWNFVEGDEFPFDTHGHGTQVAGLAAGVAFGVAPQAKILPIRVINAFGGSDALSVAAGIRYASAQGARVINLSLGTEDPAASPILEEAIRDVTAGGALVVAASGNGALDGEGLNLETHPLYPAALEIPGLLTVLATDLRGERTVYTHYSAKKVGLGAPGGTDQDGGLSSTNLYLSQGRLRPLIGSSASAPLVSGAAALLWSSFPNLSNVQIQRILESSGTKSPTLRDATRSGTSLNAYSAALRAAHGEAL